MLQNSLQCMGLRQINANHVETWCKHIFPKLHNMPGILNAQKIAADKHNSHSIHLIPVLSAEASEKCFFLFVEIHRELIEWNWNDEWAEMADVNFRICWWVSGKFTHGCWGMIFARKFDEKFGENWRKLFKVWILWQIWGKFWNLQLSKILKNSPNYSPTNSIPNILTHTNNLVGIRSIFTHFI